MAANLSNLPVLPFEKILGYLSLEDRIRSRAVSRRWSVMLNCFKLESLCFSRRPRGFIYGKYRLVRGAFARNFIASHRLVSFFKNFDQSILANLKYLRLIDLSINGGSFNDALNSLDQLQELVIIRFECAGCSDRTLELSLPTVASVWLEDLNGFEKLSLCAPKLQVIQLCNCYYLTLELIYSESVEKLLIDRLKCVEVHKLKNLKYLYVGSRARIESALLLDLVQLKEIHLVDRNNVLQLFEMKRLYDRPDLEIFYRGLSLIDPNDSAIRMLSPHYLAENHWKLADEIPLCNVLHYSVIDRVAPELQTRSVKDFLSKFTDLNSISVDKRVQQIERFLHFLNHFKHIATLEFQCDQPQALFDRLPEHCAVQRLTIWSELSNFDFLSRFEHLICLNVRQSVDVKSVRKVLEELKFLSRFRFIHNNWEIEIKVKLPKRFALKFVGGKLTYESDHLNAVTQFIVENTRPEK